MPVELTDANDAGHTGKYTSSVYAFYSTGGFEMERQFADITLLPVDSIQRYDATDAVQVKVDASVLNGKLGTYNTVDDCFKDDSNVEITSIKLTSAEFRTALASTADVISVGSLNTLYSDFKTYVGQYFGFNGGFETLFSAATEFTIDSDDKFEEDSLVALIGGTGDINATAPYTKVMTGEITIGGESITKLLRYAVDTNCFGNRTPTGTTDTVGNFGVDDKFLAGDLIWVPAGIKVTLRLAIDEEAFAPINNRGPNYVQNTNFTNGNFSSVTNASTTLIERVVKAPLLIVLK